MSVVVDPLNIATYFENVLDPVKADNLHSFCISASLHLILKAIEKHCENYKHHCFK